MSVAQITMHPVAIWRIAEDYDPGEFADLTTALEPVIDANREKITAHARAVGYPWRDDRFGVAQVMRVAAMMAAQQFVANFYAADQKIDVAVRARVVGPIRQAQGLLRDVATPPATMAALDVDASRHEASVELGRAGRHARWGALPVRRGRGAPINWQVQIRNFLTVAGLDDVVAQLHARALMRRLADIPKN